MLKDKESFVRQGALMASALVLMQENEQRCKHVKALRATIEEIAGDKRESIIAKFGAVVAAGILDAGGRNMCVALTSRTGFLRRGAVVGMMVWLNHWFWHPLLNFFSLALTPTAIIGVNKDMKMPEKFTLQVRRMHEALVGTLCRGGTGSVGHVVPRRFGSRCKSK